MPGRPQHTQHRVPVGRAALGLVGVATLVGLAFGVAPASASTDNAQLALTGVVDGNNPAGGSQIGVHPGSSVAFTASAFPTQKAKDLANSVGAGGLISGLLGNVTYQVKADFSGLPGGHRSTVLKGNGSATFHFSHTGTYHFTWTAQKVTTISTIFGSKSTTTDISLNGNQAKKAGVTLNASNDYVGAVKVAKNVSSGISVQLPSVGAHPSAPVVGKLPKIKVPGVSLPTVHVSVPNLKKVTGALGGIGSKGKTPTSGGSGGSGSSGKAGAFNPGQSGELPVPAQVVPQGGGGGAVFGGGGGGLLSNGGSVGQFAPLNAVRSGTSGKVVSPKNAKSPQQVVDVAAKQTPAAQLPVVLAIIAIVTLSAVGALYARLFFLRRASTS